MVLAGGFRLGRDGVSLDEEEERTWEPSLLFSHLFCSAEVQEVTELLGVYVSVCVCVCVCERERETKIKNNTQKRHTGVPVCETRAVKDTG